MNSVLKTFSFLAVFAFLFSVRTYAYSSPITPGLVPPEPEFKDEMVQRGLSQEYIIEKKPIEGPKVEQVYKVEQNPKIEQRSQAEQKPEQKLGVEIVNNDREGQPLLDSLSDACRLGDGSSCHFLAEYYVEQKMPSMAKDYFEKACENKHEQSCLRLGTTPNKG